MKTILLVTGNAHKLAEWQRMMPAEITLDSIDLDLEEIQSDDPLEIITDKVKKAYLAAGKPVIIEDVSAGLDAWQGLPGPFIKFFLKKLGKDALYQLAGDEQHTAVVSCSAAYYDGTHMYTTKGDVHGTIVAPRGESFGFDSTFVPNGQVLTYAEMDPQAKDSLSHRSLAIRQLLEILKTHGVI